MPPIGLNPANYNPQAATSLLSSDPTSLQGMDPMALLAALFGGSPTGGVQSPQATAAGSPTAAAPPGGSTCSCGGNCAQGGACSCGCNASQRSNELGF